MREIKFRAKKKTRKKKYQKWVYGNLYTDIEDCFIMYRLENGDIEFESCIKETIGQFTGLYDKKKVPVYEGDLLKIYFDINEIDDYIFFSLNDEEKENGYYIKKISIPEFYAEPISDDFEVIGNIYDNEVEE